MKIIIIVFILIVNVVICYPRKSKQDGIMGPISVGQDGIIFPDATTTSRTTLSSSGGSSQTSLEENKVVESKHEDKCFG